MEIQEEHPAPAPDTSGDSPQVRVMSSFVAALKAVGFYPPANPVRESMVQAFLAVLRDDGEISLSLGQEAVRVGDQAVLHRGDELWDLFMRLFEAGLRDLTFLPETTAGELQELLSLLACTARGELNPTDEDLSVLLWEMDLPSIAYRVIDAAEETPPMPMMDEEAPPGAAAEDPAAWEGIHPLERYLASAGGLEETDLDPRTLQVDGEDVARLARLAKQEAHQLRPKLIMVLLELLLVGLAPEEFDRVIALVRGHALDLLQMGRFSFYRLMLRRLRERAEEVAGDQGERLTALIGELTGPETATRALAALGAERCDDAQVATALLAELQPPGLAVLLDALAGDIKAAEEDDRWRVAGAALRQAALEGPERLVGDPALLTEQHLHALARLIPTGQSGERARHWSQSLSTLWAHGAAGVRAGALSLLAAVRPPDLERLLQLGLGDEDSLVRQTAAGLYSEALGAKALQPLLQILLSHGFEQRPYEEQTAFYEALSSASPDEVFPLLEKTVRRRDWLAPRHWRVQKACALRALGSVPIEKAGALLMRYRSARDPLLAEASRYALELHRRRLQGPVPGARRAA
jgi:hypothetical protein